METREITAADRLAELVRVGLGQARIVDTTLLDLALPSLRPVTSVGTDRILRYIAGRRIFGADVLDEVEALAVFLDGEVAEGSREVFRPNEFDPAEGYLEVVRDERAKRLAEVVKELRKLARAIGDVLDAREAQQLVDRWLIEA